MTDSDVRTYIFGGDEAEASASYEERVASLLTDGFAPAGAATPIIASYLAKRELDRIQEAAAALLRASRKRARKDVIAEAKVILASWNATLAELDELTAGSLGKVYGDRITQIELLLKGA